MSNVLRTVALTTGQREDKNNKPKGKDQMTLRLK